MGARGQPGDQAPGGAPTETPQIGPLVLLALPLPVPPGDSNRYGCSCCLSLPLSRAPQPSDWLVPAPGPVCWAKDSASVSSLHVLHCAYPSHIGLLLFARSVFSSSWSLQGGKRRSESSAKAHSVRLGLFDLLLPDGRLLIAGDGADDLEHRLALPLVRVAAKARWVTGGHGLAGHWCTWAGGPLAYAGHWCTRPGWSVHMGWRSMVYMGHWCTWAGDERCI